MFALKKKYFLIVESTKDIDLRNIKKRNKFVVIYRNHKSVEEDLYTLIKFRKQCKLKSIDFYVANNLKLAVLLNSNGIYLSSFNKSFKPLSFKNKKLKIIGSAHNFKEIRIKIKQGCDYVLLSKLFQVSYDQKSPVLGVIKFNNYVYHFYKKLIPLGGIKLSNLNFLNNVNCEGFALFSEVKKKPTNIISRLF